MAKNIYYLHLEMKNEKEETRQAAGLPPRYKDSIEELMKKLEPVLSWEVVLANIQYDKGDPSGIPSTQDLIKRRAEFADKHGS